VCVGELRKRCGHECSTMCHYFTTFGKSVNIDLWLSLSLEMANSLEAQELSSISGEAISEEESSLICEEDQGG